MPTTFGLEVALPTVIPSTRRDAPPPGSIPVSRGQHLLARALPTVWEQMREVSLARVLAVMRNSPARTVLTHESAALLHGAWMVAREPDVHTICSASGSNRTLMLPRVAYTGGRVRAAGTRGTDGEGRQARVRRHRMRVEPGQVVVAHGLRVTSIPRTIADCLLDLDGLAAFVVGDSLMRVAVRPDRFVSERDPASLRALRAEVRAILVSCGRRRRKRRALRMLELLSPYAESPGESRLRYLLLKEGVPVPVVQAGFVVEGRTYFADFGWPMARVGEEYDGEGKYAAPGAVFGERRREREAARAGWRLVRATSAQLRDPRALLADLLRALPDDAVFPLAPRPWLA
ncbi:hypothetical protein [Actinomyces marmotae]|uniref:hypothetical protein n=1 Tax=Actinomyces marmotae TaxID=2737173 RepID=UPI00135BD000|nr:hypothetical protein [Actinomyces marmotae]